LSRAQSEIHPKYPATPINDKHGHTPSALPGPARSGDPDAGKQGEERRHQDTYIEIRSETHHSVNTDDNNNTCDTGDEDPRPAKRRKLRAAPAATPTICRKHPPKLRLGQHRPLVALSTTRSKMNDAQPQANHGHLSNFVDKSYRHVSRSSRSPSAAAEAVPVAEYQEWPRQGFLKRTKIWDDTTYNLKFKLPSISEHFHLPINPAALDINHDAGAHSKIHRAPLKPKKNKIPWTEEEDIKLLQMWNEGRS
jgi:hypothetical protein